jgi:hypothetical protein
VSAAYLLKAAPLGHQQHLFEQSKEEQQMAANPPKRQAPKPKKSVITDRFL